MSAQPMTHIESLFPDWATFGEGQFGRVLRGELPSPPHGSGGWYVCGSRQPSA